MKFAKGSSNASLVLGEALQPGSDDTHFCKPTDVAVAPNGEFFVSDGYRLFNLTLSFFRVFYYIVVKLVRLFYLMLPTNEPRHEKTCLRDAQADLRLAVRMRHKQVFS